ncbi:MAG TPA: efflux RND transporter periplasmic adaptor subunit [Usitatibacter sp.]|jgi:membrane fusion protein (multidrug efflux system)|nr:efflux RND transporter periplasmic adaptor subunit [Usitatibacter sp.]
MNLLPTVRRRGALAVLVASLAVLSACAKKDGDAKAANAPPPALPVTVIEVKMQKVPISLEAVGQATGSREVEIRARVNGIIEKRAYEEGAAVPANTTLFVIDPQPYELAVQDAKAALLQATTARDLAQVDVKRLEPLAKDRAISQRELDQAVAQLKNSTAAIASAEAKLKEAQLNLSYTRVTTPIGGITGRALRSEGSLVTANTDSALLTNVTQVNPIWILFPLAERDFDSVRGAQRSARVQIVDESGKLLADNGKLNFTSTTVDTKTGAVQLRAEFANPRTRWLPGQFTHVRVLAGDQDAILVPQAAVLQTEQAKVVMTVGADNKVVPKPVQTASWIGNDMIVTSGLKEGDRVITDNLVKLRPGAPVSPHAPGEPPAGAPPQGAAPKATAK